MSGASVNVNAYAKGQIDSNMKYTGDRGVSSSIEPIATVGAFGMVGGSLNASWDEDE